MIRGIEVALAGRISAPEIRTTKAGKEQATLQVTANLVQPLGQIGQRKPRKPKRGAPPEQKSVSDATRHWQAPPPALATADDNIPF